MHRTYLEGQAGVGGTAALAVARVAALALGGQAAVEARARVDHVRLLDHEAVLDELADVLARVGHRDLVHLVGVKPDLALAALEHARGEALLQTEGNLQAWCRMYFCTRAPISRSSRRNLLPWLPALVGVGLRGWRQSWNCPEHAGRARPSFACAQCTRRHRGQAGPSPDRGRGQGAVTRLSRQLKVAQSW